MKFRWKPLIFLLLIFTIFNPLNAQNLTVLVEPQSQSAEISQTISFNIAIENVNNLGGFQFDIFYNSEIIQAKAATIGDLLGSTGRTPFPLGPEIDNNANPGKITFGGATFGSGIGPNGNGVLATIEFTAKSSGTSIIDIQNVQVSDINGQAITINTVNDGQINVQSGEMNEIVITNTDDSGDGSLRWALDQANTQPGPNSIVFKIPESDANYDATDGIWTIQPTYTLPEIVDSNLVIDGASQKAFIGRDTNSEGPEIVINGEKLGYVHLLKISSSSNTVSNLVINGSNGYGLWLYGEKATNNFVWGNYFGTNAAGTDTVPNLDGICIENGSFNRIGGGEAEFRNVISGNLEDGIFVFGNAHGNHILGNFIGTDVTGTKDLGNGSLGISMDNDVFENIIGGANPGEKNIISGNENSGIRMGGIRNEIVGNYFGTDLTGTKAIGNEWAGLEIWGGEFNRVGGENQGEGNLISGNVGVGIGLDETENNQVIGNLIGTQAGGIDSLGNGASGIALTSGSKNNQIGPRNIISNNGYAGVFFYDDSTIQNTITQNSISNNFAMGIDYTNGGNLQLAPPVISGLSNGTLSGTAPANCTIEIFSDTDDEGKIYEGNTSSDNSGNFQWIGNPSGPNLTATATDAAGNTSIFSSPYVITAVDEKTSEMIPDNFELKQNYPNPFNPETIIEYQLANASFVEITIFNISGERIATLLKKYQTNGSFQLKWDGRNEKGQPVVSGIYISQLKVGKFVATKKMMLLR